MLVTRDSAKKEIDIMEYSSRGLYTKGIWNSNSSDVILVVKQIGFDLYYVVNTDSFEGVSVGGDKNLTVIDEVYDMSRLTDTQLLKIYKKQLAYGELL